MLDLIAQWHGEFVVTRFDHETGTWIFIAIHDSTLGPTLGGVRMKTYPTPVDALRDAMRLAEGMTYKWAGLGINRGGAKSVLDIPHPMVGEERRALLGRFGRLVASLRGAYTGGPDLGTTPEDLGVIEEQTEYAHGWDRKNNRPLDPGPYTALGVFGGMRAALRHAFGGDDFHGRTVLVQGVGDVGLPLARMLREAGATIAVTDVNQERATQLGSELGAKVVPPEQAYTFKCDVYAPCAVGATVNAKTIPALACRVVAGSANNQLGEPADGERLHARGILYAPDYIVNAGGAAALPPLSAGTAEADVVQRVKAIEGTIDEIFAEAKAQGISPAAAAQRRVDRVLAEGRKRRGG
jgi:leucine dehydrogenase